MMKLMYDQLGKQGRLGNQLWEIASTLGLATKRNATVEFNHWDYEPYFNIASTLFVDNPQGIRASELLTYMPESERPFMQDHHLWWHVRKQIRLLFQPSYKSKRQLEEFAWFDAIPNKVAVHIRRDERQHIQNTHPTPPRAYYERAMEIERARLGNPTFCFFSDDIQWCREQFASDNYVFVDSYPRLQDTYQADNEAPWRDHLDIFLMSRCDGHIMPNSTFSWWGAALSNNPVPIYPAVWYGEEFSHIDWRLQIPDGWVEVGW